MDIFAIFCYVPELYLMYLMYLMYLNFRYKIEHILILVIFAPFFAIFLISTLILSYFFKKRALTVGGIPNQGLWNDSTDDYCIQKITIAYILTHFGYDCATGCLQNERACLLIWNTFTFAYKTCLLILGMFQQVATFRWHVLQNVLPHLSMFCQNSIVTS